MRSKTFPAAPPSISDNPQREYRSSLCAFHSIALTAATAATDAITSSVVRHSEVESLKIPKATPRFCERTMSKNPGITLCVSKKESRDSMIRFVSRSSTNTAAAVPNAFRRRSAIQILFDRLNAPRADRRESGVRSDVGRVFPTAFALLPGGALDLHSDIRSRRARFERDLRYDEQPRQLARVFLEQRVKVAVGRQAHARLQRRPDQLFIARDLETLQDVAPQFHQTVPVGGPFPRVLSKPGSEFGRLGEVGHVDA